MGELRRHADGHRWLAAITMIVALAGAGVWLWASDSDGAPSSSDAPFLEVNPATVSSGESIDLTVVSPSPSGISFGLGGRIEMLRGDDWVPAAGLEDVGQSIRSALLEAPAGESRGPRMAAV